MASLPTNGAGSSIFHGSTPGTNGLLSTNDQFYSWLSQNVMGVLFKDAECGNGICESPEEVPGVGRFGWCVVIDLQERGCQKFIPICTHLMD